MNHPIRFIYLCGVVASVSFFDRFILVTLDDSSGASIEVKIDRIPAPTPGVLQTEYSQPDVEEGAYEYTRPSKSDDLDDSDSDGSNSFDERGLKSFERRDGKKRPPKSGPLMTDTHVENVKIITRGDGLKCYVHVKVDDCVIGNGTALKVRGTPQIWAQTFQLRLERACLVRSQDEESRIWNEYSLFVETILSNPWILTQQEIIALELEDKELARTDREKARRIQEHGKLRQKERCQWMRILAEQEARFDRRRAQKALELDGNPLDRADWRPYQAVFSQAKQASKN